MIPASPYVKSQDNPSLLKSFLNFWCISNVNEPKACCLYWWIQRGG